MAAIGGEVPQQVVEDGDTLVVGDGLSLVLPNGGLPRQAVTHVSDTPALIVELIGQVVGAGGRTGVVGWPELSYAGIDADALERVVDAHLASVRRKLEAARAPNLLHTVRGVGFVLRSQ